MAKSVDVEKFHRDVVSYSLRKYKELPKQGKPNKNEWTPLSTVLCSEGTMLHARLK